MSDETIGYIILAVIGIATILVWAPFAWHSAADRRESRLETRRDQREGKPAQLRDDAPFNY